MMGREFILKCTKCKRKANAKEGFGRNPLRTAQCLHKRIMEKESEDKLCKSLKEHPECLPDPIWNVYMCGNCGFWMSDESKNIVQPREIVVPAGDGMKEFSYLKFELVKRIYKKCPQCEKRMHKFRGKKGCLDRKALKEMKCPYCGEKTRITAELFWD